MTQADTSAEALSSIKTKIPHLEQQILDVIARKGEAIADEVRNALPDLSYSSVTARFSGLSRKGLIEFVGKKAGASGRQQRVMRAVASHG